MAKKEESEKQSNIFEEWSFNDLEGNRITIKPWSFNKTIKLTKLIGRTFKELKNQIPDLTYETLFEQNLDLFLMSCPEVIGEIIHTTVDKGPEFLDRVDNALTLQALEVIINQNFMGEKAAAQLVKFLPQSVLDKLRQEPQ